MGINWPHFNGCSNARDTHVEATVKYLFICFFLGPEAVLPTEAAIEFEKKRDLSEELQEGVFAPEKDCQKQVTVPSIAETLKKKGGATVHSIDCKARELTVNKKRTLELEVFLLENCVPFLRKSQSI